MAAFRPNSHPVFARLYNLGHLTDLIVSPFAFLWIRIWLARNFFYSGKTKISNMPETIDLFRTEYKVPFVSVEFAAYLTTIAELVCPVMIVMGLATRLSALPLLIISIVIEVTYMQTEEHLYWMMLCLALMTKGAGKFSLDYLLVRYYQRRG